MEIKNSLVMKLKQYIFSAFTFLLIVGYSLNLKAQIITAEKQQTIHETINHDSFIVPPSPVNYLEVQQNIAYPISCRKQGIEGQVISKILVDIKGNTKKIIFINGVHPDLEAACKEKVKDLEFKPARNQAGEAVEGWVVIPFHFILSI